MTVQRSSLPRIPGVSIDIEFPRWIGAAFSVGVALFVVVVLAVGSLVSRSGDDSAWGAAISSDLTLISENDIAFMMTVSAASEDWGPTDGWSVALRNGRVLPAISEVVFADDDSTQVRVTIPLDGSFALADLVAIRWDPNGQLGTHFPVAHLELSN